MLNDQSLIVVPRHRESHKETVSDLMAHVPQREWQPWAGPGF